jgi:GNAT superfamily N-acetyltransferase
VITVRPFQAADRDAVIALILGIQNGEFNLGLTVDDQAQLLDIETHFLRTGGGFWVAIDADEQVVGSIGLLPKTAHCAVLRSFFVAPAWRGKSGGCAQQLYAVLLQFARAAGVSQILLDTPGVATRAQGFYRAAGFRQISRDQLPVSHEYPDRDSLLFLLNLSGPAPHSDR